MGSLDYVCDTETPRARVASPSSFVTTKCCRVQLPNKQHFIVRQQRWTLLFGRRHVARSARCIAACQFDRDIDGLDTHRSDQESSAAPQKRRQYSRALSELPVSGSG